MGRNVQVKTEDRRVQKSTAVL